MDSHDDLPDHPDDTLPRGEGERRREERGRREMDEDNEDFVEDENEEDDEATLDEEEGLLDDDEDELGDLEAEADMDIEELRRKYGYGAPAAAADAAADDEPCASSAMEEGEEEGKDERDLETATNEYLGVEGENEVEEEDGDYEPPAKKEAEPRVDPERYQAAVPEQMGDTDKSADHSQGILLWSPQNDLDTPSLNLFVHEWKAMRAGVEKDEEYIDNRDDEDALFALLSSSFSPSAAKESFPGKRANECERTVEEGVRAFSPEEVAAFEKGFKECFKNFRKIKMSYLPSRTMGELIDFYYHWKKSERYNECRRTTQKRDYMTELMENMEGKAAKQRREAAEKSAAACAAAAAAAEAKAAAATSSAATSSTSITIVHAQATYDQNLDAEYDDPLSEELPGDLWSAPLPPQEQPTESA